MHQQSCIAEWVGGDTATEAQAWNDNKDFITSLKYRIDGTNAQDLNMLLRFKQYHSYYSIPAQSWFRVLINGIQVGPSYNPTTKSSDPITDLDIDLAPYLGNMIDIELQQVGRSISFETGAFSGDATRLYSLAISGTLSIDNNELSDAVSIYPNPSESEITISSALNLDSIKVLDLNGRLIISNNLSTNAEPYVIDVSSLNKGVYFLELISGELKSTKKFIKN